MRIVHSVVCRRSPPSRRGGWYARLGGVDVTEVPRPDPDVVRAAGTGAAAAVVSFSADADAAELSLALALVLARATAGAIVDARGATVIADAAADEMRLGATDVDAEWDRLLARERQRQRFARELEQRHWQELRDTDPRTDAENDWSDV